jgi:hypothetical protein
MTAASISQDRPIRAPGGLLDPRHRPRDIYIGTPDWAVADASPACIAAESYIKFANAGRHEEMAALFAADGVSFPPNQQIVQGAEDLDRFYRSLKGVTPKLIAVDYVSTPTDCVVHIAAEEDVDGERRWALAGSDHFRVNAEGKVTMMLGLIRSRVPFFTIPEGS